MTILLFVQWQLVTEQPGALGNNNAGLHSPRNIVSGEGACGWWVSSQWKLLHSMLAATHTCGTASHDDLCPAVVRDEQSLLIHTTYSCEGQWVKNISVRIREGKYKVGGN